MEHKIFKTEIKQVTDDGEFEAVIATLGVIDHDHDVIEPGAFGNATVFIMPAHNHGSVPLGKGVIEERGDKAIVVGKLNLDTQPGKEWHSALKFDLENPPSIQEWSFGFLTTESEIKHRDGKEVRILKSMDVFEVSPLLLGAGQGTQTLSVKQRFSNQIKDVIQAVEDIAGRAEEIVIMREKKGKTLGPERKAQIEALTERLDDLQKAIVQLKEPDQKDEKEAKLIAQAATANAVAAVRRQGLVDEI